MATPHLLGLPLELRYKILAYLDREIAAFTWPFRYLEGTYMCMNVATSGVPQASILRTNRQFRDEYLDMGCYDAVSTVFYVLWRKETEREVLRARLIKNGHPEEWDWFQNALKRALDLDVATKRTKQVEAILPHVRHVSVIEGVGQELIGEGINARTRERFDLWQLVKPFVEYLESRQVSIHTLRIVNIRDDYELSQIRHSRISDCLATLQAEHRLAKLASITLLGLPLLDSQHGAQVDFNACCTYKEAESDEEMKRNGGHGWILEGDDDTLRITPGERHEVYHSIQQFGVYTYAKAKPSKMVQDRLSVLHLEDGAEYPEEVMDVLSEEERRDIANWKLQYWHEGVPSEFPRICPATITRDQHVCTLETESDRCARCRLRRRDREREAWLREDSR